MSIAEKLTEIAENVPKVYEAGVSDEEFAWWNMMTWNNSESRSETSHMFRAFDFKSIGGFKPPFRIKLKNHSNWAFNGAKGITELKTEDVDFSGADFFQYSFQLGDDLKRVGTIDISNARAGISCLFGWCYELTDVEKVILGEDLAPLNTGAGEGSICWGCKKLKNIEFEGTYADTLKFGFTTVLSKNSIISAVNAASSNATGKTLELSTTAVTNAFGSTTAQEWLDLVATKPNWTIALS